MVRGPGAIDEAIIQAMLGARGNGPIFVDLAPWAQQRFETVLQAAGLATGDVLIQQRLDQAEALRIYSAEGEHTPFDKPAIAMRPTYLMQWQANPDNPSVVISLAHELGHLVRGHLAQGPGDQAHEFELQADEFAGLVAAKMGFSAQDLEDWIGGLNWPQGCATHPPHSKRLERALLGYQKAKAEPGPMPSVAYDVGSGASDYPAVGRPRRDRSPQSES